MGQVIWGSPFERTRTNWTHAWTLASIVFTETLLKIVCAYFLHKYINLLMEPTTCWFPLVRDMSFWKSIWIWIPYGKIGKKCPRYFVRDSREIWNQYRTGRSVWCYAAVNKLAHYGPQLTGPVGVPRSRDGVSNIAACLNRVSKSSMWNSPTGCSSSSTTTIYSKKFALRCLLIYVTSSTSARRQASVRGAPDHRSPHFRTIATSLWHHPCQ